MEAEEWCLLFEGGKVKEKRQSWECDNSEFAKLSHHQCMYHPFPCCKTLFIPVRWSVIQNRSVISIGVKAAAEVRWCRIMEERRRRATEYSITVDKERGQVAQ